MLYIHAGPEIGVASTKAYTAMVTAFALLASASDRARGTLDADRARPVRRTAVPDAVEEALRSARRDRGGRRAV